ncbi:hypothetical protein AB0M20_01080 [Actinoplanes sp. NPDC051633]|uniref:hypothetical protein n=1 Tax=Actinoplanes sp. NPDC051633 TaxID=3155670 RepID=UPI0034283C75
MRKLTKRSAAIVTASVVAVGAAGAAFAWSLTGGGEASATAGTTKNLVVEAALANDSLVPGVPRNLNFVVKNKNDFPVVVTGATISEVKGGDGDCVADANVKAIDGSALYGDVNYRTLPAGSNSNPGEKTLTLVNAVRMVPTAPDACQGKNFTFTMTVSATTPS